LLPALTPDAIANLPWRYAMTVLIEGAAIDEGDEQPSRWKSGKVELVKSKAGGFHTDWYSACLRIGGKT
jgi:hypothetical protein